MEELKKDLKTPYLSIVIPAFNEELRIKETLCKIVEYIKTKDYSYEIIVVDDGSIDRTVEVVKFTAESLKESITIIKNERNIGKGGAVKNGILKAKGEFILFSDADLSTPISELDKLLPLVEGEYDIAIGSRALPESDIKLHQPWYRENMGRIFNLFVRLIAVRGIKDTQCGFKCFKGSIAKEVSSKQYINRFGFDVEILFIAKKLGYKIKEVPIKWINSPHSRVHAIKDSSEMLMSLLKIRMNDLKGLYWGKCLLEKIKILEILPYFPPRTGWSVRVEYLKKCLLAKGCKCEILNISPESRKIKSEEYIDVQNGLDYIFKVLKYCLKGYKIHIHVNGQSIKGLILTLISEFISFLFMRRCILTFHGGAKQLYFPKENNCLTIPIFFVIFTISKIIICNDESIKEKIKGYGIKRDKIKPIPAFSKQYLAYKETKLSDDLEIFINQHNPILSSYIFERPQFYIPDTLRAMRKITKDYHDLGLIFVGPEKYSQQTINLVQNLNLERNIFLGNNLTHDEFLTLLTRSKIYLRTYEWDGICSSVLQALYLKIPVIGCENPLRPQCVVRFKVGDEDSLVEKIKYVLKNYDDVKENIQLPEIDDTVSNEVELLIS
ncbi:MAG: glycosyltransferase [bacterium]